MAAAQDLYLQLKISEFCERCPLCVEKISDRHIYDLPTQQIYRCPAEISMYASSSHARTA